MNYAAYPYQNMRSRIFTLLLLLIMAIMVSADACSRTKRALVVGIGEYQDSRWGKIHGDRDISIVKDMLNKCGYTDIRTLENRKATKKGMTSAFRNLVESCRKGDIVYIHFSGHGQQITDLDGDEEDGFDEAWIPYDAEYAYSESYKGEKHLVDDEIALWMTRIVEKTGESGGLLVVVDACHSGDSSRDKNCDETYVRGAGDDFIIPLRNKPARKPKIEEKWLTLTACRDYQLNSEVKTDRGGYYGMLSYALCRKHLIIRNAGNAESVAGLQKFVDTYRRSLPQNITLTGLISSQSLSNFFK